MAVISIFHMRRHKSTQRWYNKPRVTWLARGREEGWAPRQLGSVALGLIQQRNKRGPTLLPKKPR